MPFRRPVLVPGIYDDIVSPRIAQLLAALPERWRVERHTLAKAEDVVAPLAATLIEALKIALDAKADKPDQALALGRSVLAAIREHTPKAFPLDAEMELLAERLTAITERGDSPRRPRGALHAASLIVNADGDSLLENLQSEFDSADRVDLLCAFIKLSGFERLRAEIERHCVSRARPLRVLTTTYMGASDAKAIERLAAMPHVEVRISYDQAVTRLHAKAWLFARTSGFSTAYIGSSNLSHAAQTDGLEWNVRVTESDQPALVTQIGETFEQYWSDPYLFEPFDPTRPAHRERLIRSLASHGDAPPPDGFLAEVEPKDFQRPVLDELIRARALGQHRNLLVAATGTGKTVMAALDYQKLAEDGRVDTLLYVAHRREILEQARHIFRSALQRREFGELLFQGERPSIGRHVFASIDSLDGPSGVDPSAFDMVIVDEAHHSAAKSWRALLERIAPKELLGLTGTPERADGIDYETHFPRPWVGNLRVWNAIPHALVPFRYYMLDVDGVDLKDVKWTAGRYATDELSGVLVTAADIFVQRAVRALRDHLASAATLRGIAFCVDVRHAESVASHFETHGFRVATLTGQTPSDQRRAARGDLDAGRIQILCVVDIYNEGVDVPNVNALFFFRPTESATVFLQQLGRGLRRARGKNELVVFDLTGRQRMEFRFDRRLRAVLGHTPRDLREFVQSASGRLPTGCMISFDEHAREQILQQIERAVPTDLHGLRVLLQEPAHRSLSLEAFLHETDVDLEDIYRKDRSWSGLRASAGLDPRPRADGEDAALENAHKLIHVGDPGRLDVWERLLSGVSMTSEAQHRAMRMLFALLYGKDPASDDRAKKAWASHPIVREEVAALLPVVRRRNAVLAAPHSLAPEIPLVLHARYLGVELSAAFDHRTKEGKLRDYFTGVEKTQGGAYDMLLVTLEKDDATKEHLRYRDFPLNETRFHWQSKAATRRDSAGGRRHLDPSGTGCTPLLFVRERSDDRPGVTMAFQYLGPARPVHVEGERPISIEWELEYPMPAALVRAGRVAA